MIRQMFRYNRKTPKTIRGSGILRCNMPMVDQDKGVKYITRNDVSLSNSSERGPAGWYWDRFSELGYHGPFPNRYAAMVACVLSD